jgi:hypothetical protein
MFLIPEWILAIAFLASSFAMLYRRRWEHAFSRLLLAGFYIALAVFPEIPIEVARALARWFILLLALVEVISFLILFPYMRNNKHDS